MAAAKQVAGYDVKEDAVCSSGLEDNQRCVYLVLDSSGKYVRRCCNRRVEGSLACAVHKDLVKTCCKLKGGQCRAIIKGKRGVMARCSRCRLKPEIPLCAQHYKMYEAGSNIEYESDDGKNGITCESKPVYDRIYKQRIKSLKASDRPDTKAGSYEKAVNTKKLKTIASIATAGSETEAFATLLSSENGFTSEPSEPVEDAVSIENRRNEQRRLKEQRQRAELERTRKQEEERQRAELERTRKQDEERRQAELERKRKQDEDYNRLQRKMEADRAEKERKRKEVEEAERARQREIDEQNRKAEQERKRKEAEDELNRLKAEQAKREEQERKRIENERKRQEEETKKQKDLEEAERQRKAQGDEQQQVIATERAKKRTEKAKQDRLWQAERKERDRLRQERIDKEEQEEQERQESQRRAKQAEQERLRKEKADKAERDRQLAEEREEQRKLEAARKEQREIQERQQEEVKKQKEEAERKQKEQAEKERQELEAEREEQRERQRQKQARRKQKAEEAELAKREEERKEEIAREEQRERQKQKQARRKQKAEEAERKRKEQAEKEEQAKRDEQRKVEDAREEQKQLQKRQQEEAKRKKAEQLKQKQDLEKKRQEEAEQKKAKQQKALDDVKKRIEENKQAKAKQMAVASAVVAAAVSKPAAATEKQNNKPIYEMNGEQLKVFENQTTTYNQRDRESSANNLKRKSTGKTDLIDRLIEEVGNYNGCWTLKSVLSSTKTLYLRKDLFETERDDLLPNVLTLCASRVSSGYENIFVPYSAYMGGAKLTRGTLFFKTTTKNQNNNNLVTLWRASPNNSNSKNMSLATTSFSPAFIDLIELFSLSNDPVDLVLELFDFIELPKGKATEAKKSQEKQLKLSVLRSDGRESLTYFFERSSKALLARFDLATEEAPLYLSYQVFMLQNAFDKGYVSAIKGHREIISFDNTLVEDQRYNVVRTQFYVKKDAEVLSDSDVMVRVRKLYGSTARDDVWTKNQDRMMKSQAGVRKPFLYKDVTFDGFVTGFDMRGSEPRETMWTFGQERLKLLIQASSEKRFDIDNYEKNVPDDQRHLTAFAEYSKTPARPGYYQESGDIDPSKERPWLVADGKDPAVKLLIRLFSNFLQKMGISTDREGIENISMTIFGYQESFNFSNKIARITSPVYDSPNYKNNTKKVALQDVLRAKIDALMKLNAIQTIGSFLSLYGWSKGDVTKIVYPYEEVHFLCQAQLSSSWNADDNPKYKSLVLIEAVPSIKRTNSTDHFYDKWPYSEAIESDYEAWMLGRWGTTWNTEKACRLGLRRNDRIQDKDVPFDETRNIRSVPYRPVHHIYPTILRKRGTGEVFNFDVYYLYLTDADMNQYPEDFKEPYVVAMIRAWSDLRVEGNREKTLVVLSPEDYTRIRLGHERNDNISTYNKVVATVNGVCKKNGIDIKILDRSIIDSSQDAFFNTVKDKLVLLLVLMPAQAVIGDPVFAGYGHQGHSLVVSYLALGHPKLKFETSMFAHNGFFRQSMENKVVYPTTSLMSTLPIDGVVRYLKRNTDPSKVTINQMAASGSSEDQRLKAAKQAMTEFLNTSGQKARTKHFMLIASGNHYTVAHFDASTHALGSKFVIQYFNSIASAPLNSNLQAVQNMDEFKNRVEFVLDPSAKTQSNVYTCGGWSASYILAKIKNQSATQTCLSEAQAILEYNNIIVEPLWHLL